MEAARQALRLEELRYRNGVSSYLEVLDTQRTLFDAELQLVQTMRAQYVAVVKLYKALGGGWQVGEAAAMAPQ